MLASWRFTAAGTPKKIEISTFVGLVDVINIEARVPTICGAFRLYP
jgi:hypothetical protein